MAAVWGTKTLQSFAPNWGEPELLEKTLVGRRELVDRLEQLVIDGAGGPNKHQHLIVGTRGSGKTHVLRVLYNRLRSNKELKKRLLIVYLLEDEHGVASYLDFITRMLLAITRSYPKKEVLIQKIEELYDLPFADQERRAERLLLEAAGGKDVLVLAENLGIIFDNTQGFGSKGQQKLRDLVQSQPRFMLFATSQALFHGVRNRDAPFTQFFTITHLHGLTLHEVILFLQAIAAAHGDDDLLRSLRSETGRGRIEAIYDFTGGNHRLLVIFFEFLRADSLLKLSEIFVSSLNQLRPYYQERMRALSAQQQKIVQYLSLEREARSVKEIARFCMVAPNTASRQLKSLVDLSFVSRIPRGRESYYEITETLFRICYQADLEQEGAPVRLFVDFLGGYYTAKELQRRVRGFRILGARLGNDGHLPFLDEADFYAHAISTRYPEQATDFTTTPERWRDDLHSFFKDLAGESAYREITEFSKYLGVEEDAVIHHTAANAHLRLGQLEKAIATAKTALEIDPNDASAHNVLSRAYVRSPEHFEAALEHAKLAYQLDHEDPESLAALGIALQSKGDHIGALEWFSVLTAEYPDNVDGWCWTGVTLWSLERLTDSETAFRKALDRDPKSTQALSSLGALAASTGRYKEALGHLETLNKLHPHYAQGWWLTAHGLVTLERLEEAEIAYRKALDLDPENVGALRGLAILVNNAGRYEEGLSFFDTLNRVSPNDAEGWQLAGRTLASLERLEETEAAYRKALEFDPDEAETLILLGQVVGISGRHEEALVLFEKVIELNPDAAEGWRSTGQSLANLKRFDQAETAYRRALELDPQDADALALLGVVIGDMGRNEEALVLFEKLISVRPNGAKSWVLTGRALADLERLEDAEAAYRKALGLDAENSEALVYLGMEAATSGRFEEALALFEVLNKLRPDFSLTWLLTGMAFEGLERLEEAETAYRKALESDRSHPLNWHAMATILERLGRTEDAAEAYDKAVELGTDKVDLLVALGEARRGRGDYELAISFYERALRENAENPHALWNIVSALLGLGRIDDAVDQLSKALEADPERANVAVVTQSLHENCMELFEHAGEDRFAEYLVPAIDRLESTGRIERFVDSLSLTVFALLKRHEQIDEPRFRAILRTFEEVIAGRVEARTAIRFLEIGIAHFKEKDDKALLRLAREERRVFCKELDVPFEGG